MLHGMWDLPRPGIELVSPAVAGRFLTTVHPGKSSSCLVFFYLFILKINLFSFIYFWLCWVFTAAHRLSLVAASGLLVAVGCCEARALGGWASVVVVHRLSSCGSWALERRFGSCGARA